MGKDQVLKFTQNAGWKTIVRVYPSSGNFTTKDIFFFEGKTRTQKRDFAADKISVQWISDKKVLTITRVSTAEREGRAGRFCCFRFLEVVRPWTHYDQRVGIEEQAHRKQKSADGLQQEMTAHSLPPSPYR